MDALRQQVARDARVINAQREELSCLLTEVQKREDELNDITVRHNHQLKTMVGVSFLFFSVIFLPTFSLALFISVSVFFSLSFPFSPCLSLCLSLVCLSFSLSLNVSLSLLHTLSLFFCLSASLSLCSLL